MDLMERICTACLSADRKLCKLEELQFFYDLLVPETEFNLPEVRICWECKNTLRKCSQFQGKALMARDLLVAYCLEPNSYNEQDLWSHSHTTLRATTQTKFDYNYVYEESTEVKQEPVIDEAYQDTLALVKLERTKVTASSLPILPGAEMTLPMPNDPLCESPEKVVIDNGQQTFVPGVPKLKMIPSSQMPVGLMKKVQKLPTAGSSKDNVIKLTKLSPEQIRLLKDRKDLKVKPKKLVVIDTDNLVSAPERETSTVGRKRVWKGVKVKKSLVGMLKELKEGKSKKGAKKSNVKAEKPMQVPTTAEIYQWFVEALGDGFQRNIKVIVMTEAELAIRREEMSREPQYANAQFKCADCIVGYYSEQQLLDHRTAKHTESVEQARTRGYCEPSRRQCLTCRTYVPSDRFAFHYGRHRVLYQCVMCEQVFVDVGKARAHNKGHEAAAKQTLFACTVCGRSYSSRHRLKRHKEVHLPAQTAYTCEVCGKGFAAKWSLEYHVKRHAASPERVKCEVCHKEYKNRYTFASHYKNVHDRDPSAVHRCEPCALSFVSEQCLNAHRRCARAHLDPAHFKHICPSCGKGFMSERHLRDHDNYVHRGQTEYVCNYCNKMYSSAGGLRKHIKFVHEGVRYVKNKKCNVCGKAFTSPKTLREHQNIHNGTRPFKCPVCGDTFKQSAALYTHRRLVHLGYKMRNKKIVKLSDEATTDN